MHDLATLRRLNRPSAESIRISLLTAVFTKSAIDASYPGGLAAFRKDEACAQENRDLVAIVGMSGGDLRERLDAIAARGLDLARCCAVADMFAGPIEGCTDIEFFATGDDPFQCVWMARAAPTGTSRRHPR